MLQGVTLHKDLAVAVESVIAAVNLNLLHFFKVYRNLVMT